MARLHIDAGLPEPSLLADGIIVPKSYVLAHLYIQLEIKELVYRSYIQFLQLLSVKISQILLHEVFVHIKCPNFYSLLDNYHHH